MATRAEVRARCWKDCAWEAEHVSKRPLRGPQCEIIRRVEKFIGAHEGGVMTIKSARQTGKNEVSAILHRRHLWRRQNFKRTAIWIRTAPTHKPQIVNSKKRLREILNLSTSNRIRHPLFENRRLIKEEGYIWRLGNASIEFLSSGPQSNVVGGTASTALDMDEAHKIDKDKFDEDFAPFTANTNAGTLLWGVGGNGLDTLQWYIDSNKEAGRSDLNLSFPAPIWMEENPAYAQHVEDRIKKLGETHPIIRTQYFLEAVSASGLYMKKNHVRNLFSGNHEREVRPEPGVAYQALVDVAASNEEFDPDKALSDKESAIATDSTVIWIYKVLPILCSNGVFPIIQIVDMVWMTGEKLARSQQEVEEVMDHWNIEKITIDGVGVGRQLAESIQDKYGKGVVEVYVANNTSVSEDCWDLLARLNHSSVLMFRDDDSKEYKEFVRQCGWTAYTAKEGKMKLEKPKADRHIDMVKALTYINRNAPVGGMQEIYAQESDMSVET